MNKNLALIALFFLVASTTAQTNKSCDSTYNTLLKSSNNPYGPEGLSQPQNVTGLKFCQKQLEGKLSCCSADTINSLNNVAQQQVSAINQDAQKLDQSAITFVKAAAQIQLESSNYTAEVQKLNGSSTLSTRILLQIFERMLQGPGPNQTNGTNKTNGTNGSGVPQQGAPQQGAPQQGQRPQAMNSTQANQTKATIMQELLGQQKNGSAPGGQQQQQQGKGQSPNLNQKPKASSVLENVQSQMKVQQPSEMKGLLQQAQQARAQCMKYLAKLKTQFACMACDYKNITAALSSGSLTLSNQICTDIQSNCYDFANLNQNVSLMRNSDQMQQQLQTVQQQRLSLNQINNNITTMNQQLIEGGVNSTNQTIGKISQGLSQLTAKQQVDNSSNSTFVAKSLPTSCKSKTDCTYLCSHFINIAQGGIDFSRAQNPGENVTVDASSSSSIQQLSDKSLQPGGGNSMAPPQQPNGTRPLNQTQSKLRQLQLSTSATFSATGVTPEDSGLSSVVETSVSTDPAGVSSTTVTASLDNIVSNPSTTTQSTYGSLFNFCFALFVGLIALLQ